METNMRFFSLANAITTLASIALFSFALTAEAQSLPSPLASRDSAKVEIYPRYPVSQSFSPGAGPFISDPDRASVSVVIYDLRCPATIPIEVQLIRTSMVGNRFEVTQVPYGSSPVCGFVGETLGPAVYSVFLEDLGPGMYQAAVTSRPGASPSDTITMVRDFVVLNLDQAGKAVVEIPARASVQSGVGLISGWACIADRVEISVDGGARINVPGEMGRLDVSPICGHGTAGFGLLTNFNLLGAGTHTIQVYVKGVAIGEPTRFSVVVPAGEFVGGITREITIPNFPSAGRTATVDWREAEQNFGLKDVR